MYISVGSEKSPVNLVYSFEKHMKTASDQNEFEIMESIVGDRAQKRRVQLLHKQSRVLCWLQFGFDSELAESSQIIRDYINHGPICKRIQLNTICQYNFE